MPRKCCSLCAHEIPGKVIKLNSLHNIIEVSTVRESGMMINNLVQRIEDHRTLKHNNNNQIFMSIYFSTSLVVNES